MTPNPFPKPGDVYLFFGNGHSTTYSYPIANDKKTCYLIPGTDIKLGDLVYGLDINNEIITGVVVQLHSKTLLVLWADLAETSYQLSPSVKFPTYKGACSVKEGSGW